MLKFYFDTVIIWFIVYVTSGILFRKEFTDARDKLRKAIGSNEKINGYIKTTLFYLLVSFVPMFRLLLLILKFNLIINTEAIIEVVKKANENNKTSN